MAGYLDLFLMLFKKLIWMMSGSFEAGGISPGPSRSPTRSVADPRRWSIAAVSRLRPRLVSLRAGSWLFATLAIWAALLRLPLYGACSLFLAAGLGRPISTAVATRGWSPRTVRYTLAGLLGLLAVLAALSSGRAGDPGTPRGGRIAAATAAVPATSC